MIVEPGIEAFPAPPEVVRAWIEYLARFKAWEARFFAWWDRPEACRLVPAWKHARYWLSPLREAEKKIVEADSYWRGYYSRASGLGTSFSWDGREVVRTGVQTVLHHMGEEIRVFPVHCRLQSHFWDCENGLSAQLSPWQRARFFGEIYNEEDVDRSPRIVEIMYEFGFVRTTGSREQSWEYPATTTIECNPQIIFHHRKHDE